MGPVGAADVAQPLVQLRVQGRLELRREDVDVGVGEVGQPAGVVEVEVGDRDVADVGGG